MLGLTRLDTRIPKFQCCFALDSQKSKLGRHLSELPGRSTEYHHFVYSPGPKHHHGLHGHPAQHRPGHSLCAHFILRHCPPPQVGLVDMKDTLTKLRRVKKIPCRCFAGHRQGRRRDGCLPLCSETSARTAEEEATSAASRTASV